MMPGLAFLMDRSLSLLRGPDDACKEVKAVLRNEKKETYWLPSSHAVSICSCFGTWVVRLSYSAVVIGRKPVQCSDEEVKKI